LTPTSASSATALAVLSMLSRRLSRAALSDFSSAGVFPSSSGTALSGALRAKRTPVIAVGQPGNGDRDNRGVLALGERPLAS
jgi:hypothetical protein